MRLTWRWPASTCWPPASSVACSRRCLGWWTGWPSRPGPAPRASGRCMGSATWSWWPCLPSAGYCAAARPTTSRRALPSGWGWLRWCWRWRPPGWVGSWWSGWASGSMRAPTWTHPAPCPAPPPGPSGPPSPNRSEAAFLQRSEHHDQPPAATTRGAVHRRAAEDDPGAVAQGIRYTLKGQHQTEGKTELTVEPADVERIIAAWPGPQQNVARQLLAKYGPPNEATPTRLFWHRNRPWKRTELTSDAVVHHWPAPHTDFLTQYLNYRVPPELTHLITMFDGSILVDRTRGEVAARCDSEAANVLGLNMVHELVTGKRTVAEARHTSEQNTVAYNGGRAAPYAERLLFDVPRGGTEDLDEGHLAGAVLQQAVGKLKDAVTPGGGEEATDRRTPS